MARALIVGCGRVAGYLDGCPGAPAASHAAAYARTPGIEVAEYIDVVVEKARALARKYQSRSFGTDLAAALARHAPDVVSVCTPDDTHAAVAERVLGAAAAPRVLFLEKPACSTPEEFARLKSLAARRNTVVIVNHSRRFDARYECLRRMVAAGRFGKLARADAFYYGGWRHNGSHIVDTLRFLFGDATLESVEPGAPSRHPGDPTRDAVLALAGGARAHAHGFDEKRYQLFDFDFKFERARLRVENFESRWIFERRVTEGGENVLTPARLGLGAGRLPPMRRALALIAQYLKTGDRGVLDPHTLEAAENTMQVLWEGAR